MAWKTMAALTAALTTSCSTQPAEPANNHAEAAAPANDQTEAAAPADPIERRFRQTMTGQPLTRPPEPFELLVTWAEYDPGDVIPCHTHSYPRYVYLQQGELLVTYRDTGAEHRFAAGEVLVESIGQRHQGEVTSDVPVVLVAFEQVPLNGNNRTPC